MVDTQQEPLIPAWTYGHVWRRYSRYCKEKMLDPFSEVAVAIWRQDFSVHLPGEILDPPELEIINDIVHVGMKTS